MTPSSELEIAGTLFSHPFAELLVEIEQAGLSGSMRLAHGDKKCVIYFKTGKIVFAVSNARSSRLFEMLTKRGRFKQDEITAIPNFSNDFELSAALVSRSLMSKADVDALFLEQVEAVVIDALSWPDGEWTYSPLARIREGLEFPVDMGTHIVHYGRCLTMDLVLGRFRTLEETFTRTTNIERHIDMTPVEAFVLSRADELELSASSLIGMASLPQEQVLHAIYTLWLAGFLVRGNWNPAFSKAFIQNVKAARLELKKEAKPAPAAQPPQQPEPAAPPAEEKPADPKPAAEPTLTVEEYLKRVETAETYYDILGVDSKAETEELKKAYFWLARNFHPDRYHAEGGPQLKKIQAAFTELAQAHETLKTPESREVYDYRMRKELAEREKIRASGQSVTAYAQQEQAAENFERGYNLLMDNDPAAAAPFLARAAHFSPNNPRHRAYLGQALSFDEKQRHKAEAEIQAAIRLDPNNPAYRLMIAEFFIKYNLLKRAEGELNRLLAAFPSNREAREMLSGLKARA